MVIPASLVTNLQFTFVAKSQLLKASSSCFWELTLHRTVALISSSFCVEWEPRVGLKGKRGYLSIVVSLLVKGASQ